MLGKCGRAGYSKADVYNAEQGFVDQENVFYTKREALLVAIAAGQYTLKVGSKKGMLIASDIFLAKNQ